MPYLQPTVQRSPPPEWIHLCWWYELLGNVYHIGTISINTLSRPQHNQVDSHWLHMSTRRIIIHHPPENRRKVDTRSSWKTKQYPGHLHQCNGFQKCKVFNLTSLPTVCGAKQKLCIWPPWQPEDEITSIHLVSCGQFQRRSSKNDKLFERDLRNTMQQ